MKLRSLIIFIVLCFLGYIGYNFFFKKADNFLDIEAKIPVYHYDFQLPKEPEIVSLELGSQAASSVDPVAKSSEPVHFKRTDPDRYLKNMCSYRQQNPEENCNSIVGIMPRPISSGNPTVFTQF